MTPQLRDLSDVRKAVQALGRFQGPPCKVADLPAAEAGAVRFATDALKVGETTGGGTGAPVYRDATGWRRFSDDATAST